MEESVLLGTKPLVDSMRHFIRDPSGVFFVCHLCECRIVQCRGKGILGLAAREMEREPKNERGGGKGSLSLPFFPTPSPLFHSRHFSRGRSPSFLVLCSETARTALETLLRRLGNNRNSHCTFLLIGNPCLYLPYYRFSFSSSYKK